MASRTTSTRSTVVGVFHDRQAAQDAIGDLKRAGFTEEQIGYTARHMDASGVSAADFLGPILGGAAAGAALGAAGGGIVGGLVTTGVPEEEARFYDSEFRSGRHIVTVKANGRYQEAH